MYPGVPSDAFCSEDGVLGACVFSADVAAALRTAAATSTHKAKRKTVHEITNVSLFLSS